MKAGSYKWYLLGLLLLVQAFSGVDRVALGFLTQNIKLDLSLTDSELGAVDGMAFALFYATMGIPLARWADRGHRGKILAVTTALWSVAVALCGVTRNFIQLVLTRVFAGVGEAGSDATTSSLIPDYFGRTERARAVTIFMLGGPLGTVIGYGVGGWIGQHYGWRVTFAAMGLPGLGLAILAACTVRESRKSFAPAAGLGADGQLAHPVNLLQTCETLWKNVTFRHLVMSTVVAVFFSNGIYAWVPAFFVRSFGMHIGELGFWLAVTNGGAGFLSTYLGGELAHRFACRDEPLQLKWMAIVTVFATIALGGVFLVHDRYIAFGSMAVFIVLGCLPQGPSQAIQLTVVPQRMRATSVAIVSLLSSLIGMGIGPIAGGVLSDLLHPMFGEESLRYALLILTPGYLWSAWHTWAPHRTVLHDARMAEVDLEEAPELRMAIRCE